MNPIVYNKNGMFRYNDFVGYLPEFLRSEPDVVTLMQVMSDYINNAYRNIETAEEFEFLRVCHDGTYDATRTAMERLCSMLQLASERGDRVCYLSVPRNNSKSNAIVGNEGAQYAKEVEIDLPEIEDVITSASGRHLVDGTDTKDGTVVYVKYRNAEPVRTVAYYYSAVDDSLVKDEQGTSQDPFTGTDNNPSTAIEFSVSDVGHVLRRYGGENNNVKYYEVFFTAKITDVKRVNAIDSVLYDVDGIDKNADQVIVDYYNQTAVVDGNFNTFIKFADGNGFNWVGGFPSGIFYLRDTSGAKLTTVTSSNRVAQADTALNPSVDRYRVSKIDIDSSGLLKIYTLNGMPGVYSDALFYLMCGTEQVGLVKMNGTVTSTSRKEDGELYTTVFPVSLKYEINDIIAMIGGTKPLVLVSIPLSQSYYTINYEDSLPIVKWSDEYMFLDNMSVGMSSDVRLRSAELESNLVLVTLKVWEALDKTSFYSERPIERSARCVCNGAWDGIASVTGCALDHSKNKYLVRINTDIDLSFDPAGPVDITTPTVGLIGAPIVQTETECQYELLQSPGSMVVWNAGDVVLVDCLNNGNPETRLFTVNDNLNDRATIRIAHPMTVTIPANTAISRVVETDRSRVNKVNTVRLNGEQHVATVRRYTGPVLAEKYMTARIYGASSDSFSLLKMVSDVCITEADGCEFVYDDEGNVNELVKSVVYDSDGNPVEQIDRNTDTLKHFSVGYKKIYNAFMPYSGPVTTLEFGEKVNYDTDTIDVTTLPLYIKKTSDICLRYGWKERQYLYYGNDIGIDDMARAGFVEFYAGNENNIVEVDMSKRSVNVYDEATYGTAIKNGLNTLYAVDIDSNLSAAKQADGSWLVTMASAGHGVPSGAKISVAGVMVDHDDPDVLAIFNVENVDAIVVSPDVIQYVTESPNADGLVHTGEVNKDGHIAMAYCLRPTRADYSPLEEGDIISIVDANGKTSLYIASAGDWKRIEPDTVIAPFTLYTQQNLFEDTLTNPTFAISEGYKVRRIEYIDEDTAQVVLVGSIPSTDLCKGTRVYIRYADNSAYNGWHTVTSDVNGGGIFNIKIDGHDGMETGHSLLGKEMTLYVGMWYKYTVTAYDWSKASNYATYVTTNEVIEISGTTLRTKYKHGFSVGDRIILDIGGQSAYTYDSGSTANFLERTVAKVLGDETFVIDESVPSGQGYTAYRGVVVNKNIPTLVGEYSLDGHRFTEGEIIIATDQLCEGENIAWRVTKDTSWIPMRKKRTFKIDAVTVDLYKNPKYDETDPLSDEVEYKYRVYGDNTVKADTSNGNAFMQAAMMSRNYNFSQPHVDNLDTTQDLALQYSSKYDYGSVAPRDDMSSEFRGVPDMDYPLVEKIERLAYLKDASVIDYKLIGYLARFMGYDITSVADDVNESGVYHTNEERENALRETIAHLPQYYALNGTNAGINMLMATFGLVGDLITMWTNTEDPYGELIRQDDVPSRIASDLDSGVKVGQWVPTPHVVLDVYDDTRFPEVTVTMDDIKRLKEQIRVCKPINVVFDGIRLVIKAESEVYVSLVADTMKGVMGDMPVFGIDEPIEIDTCEEDDCSF